MDCNVPAGTPLAAPFDCTVVDVYDDRDYFHGWGPRVIVEPRDPSECPAYVLFGHLDPLTLRVGDMLRSGEILSHIAPPPNNGNWFAHLHVQLLSQAAFELHAATKFEELDGYGHPDQRETLRSMYPDPSWLVRQHIIEAA
jgi:hypothetical protein